jgi:hypothetical protein
MRFYTHYYTKSPDGTVEHCPFTEVQAKDYNVDFSELGIKEFDASRMIDSFNRQGRRWGWYHSLQPFDISQPL